MYRVLFLLKHVVSGHLQCIEFYFPHSGLTTRKQNIGEVGI
jgi:hypothetical protein